jgi:hypothetical protein
VRVAKTADGAAVKLPPAESPPIRIVDAERFTAGVEELERLGEVDEGMETVGNVC